MDTLNEKKSQQSAGNPQRRAIVRETKVLNGIDYLEVSKDQKTILLYFLHNLPGQNNAIPATTESLTIYNVTIQGGTPQQNIPILSANTFGNILTLKVVPPKNTISKYTLNLVSFSDDSKPPQGFDPQLSTVEFLFKVDEQSEFDCKQVLDNTQQSQPPSPVIDYLAKDFASFQKLLLDRLAVTMPEWQERNPSDIGIMLVELLAYAGDRLSYFQDAVATEAYLGTARLRASIRRHARLLDYHLHDGCNARAWLTLEVTKEGNGKTLFGASDRELHPGTRFFTKIDTLTKDLSTYECSALLKSGIQIFETMHDITLYQSHNLIHFYPWDAQEYYLPVGATKATLENKGLNLKQGDVLIFEEVLGSDSGEPLDADLNHRHVVRLTKAIETQDELHSKDLLEIEWDIADALPFTLCISTIVDNKPINRVSVARGNVVLVDCGCTVQQQLPEISADRRYRPLLEFAPLTQQAYVSDRKSPFNPKAPASEALRWSMRSVLPQIYLQEDEDETGIWRPQRDLLNSESFALEFVVETEDDGRAYLRFGDDILGKRPEAPTKFTVTYRIGNGGAGNVAAEAIQRIDPKFQGLINKVRNPLPAKGGTEPESIEKVRLDAPQAFRVIKRAVTEEDYATITQRFPGVHQAIAIRRWTGSWYTIFITVDREGGRAVDSEFKQNLMNFLESYRLAGQEIAIASPIFIGLDISMTVQVASNYFRSQIKAELLDVFSNRILTNGNSGFFHPDNFTFAQPVFLSQVIATAMQVTGVVSVNVKRFQRLGEPGEEKINAGQINFGRLEIARLDNDPGQPDNGKIEFEMEGGL